ncbi:MAG TPA: beta-L-arabinofuranosidase domain-containing protein, partial [Bryobacteraceae bacterium]|nr:beta-L-arabinofuranosidase domain-containing protein [Bryobacteraceae bacterium]
MSDDATKSNLSRRAVLGTAVLAPLMQDALVTCAEAAEEAPLNAVAGVDRVVIQPGKTYLRGWAGYGDPPAPNKGPGPPPPPPPPVQGGPAPKVTWSKDSGPGNVTFADAAAPVTTAAFSALGNYVLRLTADNGRGKSSSTLHVAVETPPPAKQLDAVYTKNFKIGDGLWKQRAKALIVNWIPHCIDQINRTDLTQGPGGIDNFVEAAKALRAEPHGSHKGFVFSNAWVHQTVESMSIALMIDPQGDQDIIKAHEKMRATLDDWIPKILAAQEPDGYLQTAFTCGRRVGNRGRVEEGPFNRWERRDDHEGYVAGYFIESAINHYLLTEKKDARLYNAAKKLADCWCANIGPAPKKAWYDGHQEMEQALVRFGRFVNDMEGGGKGDKYIQLAKFLLDCRYTASTSDRERREYDQAHLPVQQQYEAVGHAVRAVYSYSGMADVAVETHDPDYQSAV